LFSFSGKGMRNKRTYHYLVVKERLQPRSITNYTNNFARYQYLSVIDLEENETTPLFLIYQIFSLAQY